MRKSHALLLLSILGLLVLTGCSGSSPKFQIHTQYNVGVQYYDDPNVANDGFCADCSLRGVYVLPYPLGYSDSHGYRTYEVDDVSVPATWNLARYQSPHCPYLVINKSAYVQEHDTVPLPCIQQPYWGASPSSVDVHSAPSSITLSGDPEVIYTYGMPSVELYNENGDLIGTVAVTSGDASSVTFATPAFLLTQYDGSYVVIINNVNADSSLSPAAAAAIDVYGNGPPPQCDPTGQFQANCEARYGWFWDCDSCSCQPI